METVREMQAGRALDEDVVMKSLDDAGIERSLITGFDETTSAGSVTMPNELVAEIAERHPGRFIPFCGVDILKGMDAVREMEHWIRDRGFAGLSLRPFMIDLPADDRHYYPFYAKCVELGVPLSIHTSANWTTGRVNELGHPRYLDTVATHFPELKIVMSHAGYPWVLDACLLAWKHQNVYLELAAHRPKYMARSGTGWEPLLRYGSTTIRDKVLYGSGWFLMGRPPGELIAELRELPVPQDVLDDWLYDNSARLMAGDEPRPTGVSS
jgi:predicted TIM-barrel fold metal-dependent hydrolase